MVSIVLVHILILILLIVIDSEIKKYISSLSSFYSNLKCLCYNRKITDNDSLIEGQVHNDLTKALI